MPAASGAEPGQAPLLLSVFAGFGVGGQQVALRHGREPARPVAGGTRSSPWTGTPSCRERLDRGLDVSFPDVRTGKA